MDLTQGLTLLIALTALAGLALLGVSWWRRRQAQVRPRSAEPSCGKCGYPTRGLASFTCPECGSDLREVGIATPAMRRAPGPVMWAVLWTLFLPSPAIWLSGLLTAKVLPTPVVTEVRRTIGVIDPTGIPLGDGPRDVRNVRPPFYSRRNIDARATGRGLQYGQSRPPKPVPVTELSLTIEVRRPKDVGPLTVDIASGAWHYTDATGRTVSGGGPFVPAVVEQYLGDAGFRDTDGQIQVRAEEVHWVAETLPQAPQNLARLGPGGRSGLAPPSVSTTTPKPLPWMDHALFAFWAVVWLVGIVWIVRRHRSGKLAAP